MNQTDKETEREWEREREREWESEREIDTYIKWYGIQLEAACQLVRVTVTVTVKSPDAILALSYENAASLALL